MMSETDENLADQDRIDSETGEKMNSKEGNKILNLIQQKQFYYVTLNRHAITYTELILLVFSAARVLRTHCQYL